MYQYVTRYLLELKEDDMLWSICKSGWVTATSVTVYSPLITGTKSFNYQVNYWWLTRQNLCWNSYCMRFMEQENWITCSTITTLQSFMTAIKNGGVRNVSVQLLILLCKVNRIFTWTSFSEEIFQPGRDI